MPEELAELFARPDLGEDLAQAARLYLATRTLSEEASAAKKKADERESQAEQFLLHKLLEANLTSIGLVIDGRTFKLSKSKTPYYSVLVEAMDDKSFLKWLDDAQGTDLAKLRLNPQSFSKFCRELVEAGKSLHPQIRLAERQGISVRKE